MAVRTFYWHTRVVGRARMIKHRLRGGNASFLFRTGNAGDIYNRDVIRTVYGEDAVNIADEGRRLLLIGSVAHNVRDGDVVAGIGTKGEPIPSPREAACRIVAVRGPLTLEAFAAAGHDVSGVRSQLDPGLLIRFDVPDAPAVRGRAVLVPHYRERDQYRRRARRGLSVIDIDAEPVDVARQIQAAEVVYTSSLHGMVFAHALRRPCVLVAPLTPEPELKYRDYLASVGLPWRGLPSLDEALRGPAPVSPLDLEYSLEDFALPALAELRAEGVAG